MKNPFESAFIKWVIKICHIVNVVYQKRWMLMIVVSLREKKTIFISPAQHNAAAKFIFTFLVFLNWNTALYLLPSKRSNIYLVNEERTGKKCPSKWKEKKWWIYWGHLVWNGLLYFIFFCYWRTCKCKCWWILSHLEINQGFCFFLKSKQLCMNHMVWRKGSNRYHMLFKYFSIFEKKTFHIDF